MASGLFWVRVVPLVALLWGLPAEVRAELFEQTFVDGKVERLKTVQSPSLSRLVQLPLVKQAGTVKQNEATQDVLLEVEGALTEGDAKLDDGSLYDVHLFDGQAGQIVRITLASDEFDTFLLLKDASGEDLTRNDDGSEGSNAEIVFRLPSTGQYQIFANAYNEGGRGAYRLTVATSDEAALHRAELKAEADRLLEQGNNSLRISQYREASEFWQSALEIYLELGDRQGEANSLGNLGSSYYRLGEYQNAINFQQQALAIAREIGDHRSEANSLGNLGIAYYSLGEYQRAIDSYQQSLAVVRKIPDRQGEAILLGSLGLAYYSLGEYQRAIDFHQQSLVIKREIVNRQGEASSLGNLGLAYASLGEYQRAIDFYQQYLVIAREIVDRQGESNSLSNLGLAYYSLGEYQRAIDLHQQSLAIAREIGDRQGEAISLNNLGFSYLNQGEAALAENYLFESIAIFDNLRSPDLPDQNRISFFETQVSAYRNLQKALVLQEKFEAALEIAERGRTRSFVQVLEEKLSSGIEDSPELTQSPSFSEIQRIAKEQQSTLVEYSFASNSSDDGVSLYIWLVQPTGELHFKEVSVGESLTEIAELVEQSRRAMNVRGRGGFQLAAPVDDESTATDELHELYELLIEPIANFLPNDPGQPVVFIPQSELFLVPFSALQNESGEYLIEQHTILTAPSIQVLNLTRRQAIAAASRSEPATRILTIGNPTMPDVWDSERNVTVQLPSLIGAEQEALAIAFFFG